MSLEKVLAAHKKGDKVADMLASVEKVISSFKRPDFLTKETVSKQTVSDNVQCYTQFEPHFDRTKTLKDLVISGLAPDGQTELKSGWLQNILEQLLDPNIVSNAKKQGYLDFKNIIYGNTESGALSIRTDIQSAGLLYICECPGVWGQLPKGFTHLWEADVHFFLSPASESNHRDPKHAVEWERADSDEICIHLKKPVAPGKMVLTIVPTKQESNIMISTLLIP